MKKFEYKLQRLLNIKLNIEKLLKEEYARLNSRRDSHIKAKQYYEDLSNDQRELFINNKIFHQEDASLTQNYLNFISNQIYNQDLGIKDYEIKMDKKRKEIIDNQKEKKILEKLKEKKIEEYKYEIMLEDRKVIDEIAARVGLKY